MIEALEHRQFLDALPPAPHAPVLRNDGVLVFDLEAGGELRVERKKRVINVDVRAYTGRKAHFDFAYDEIRSFEVHGSPVADNIRFGHVIKPTYILGGAGNDTIWGGSGDDRVLGGAGNDRIFGRGGRDALFGQDGNDVIYSGHDDSDKERYYYEEMHGGANQSDWLDGGAGFDRGNTWFVPRVMRRFEVILPDSFEPIRLGGAGANLTAYRDDAGDVHMVSSMYLPTEDDYGFFYPVERVGNKFVFEMEAYRYYSGVSWGWYAQARNDLNVGDLANGTYEIELRQWGRTLKRQSFTIDAGWTGARPEYSDNATVL